MAKTASRLSMEARNKTKLSSDLIFPKLLATACAMFFVVSLFINANSVDFKKALEYKIFLLVFAGFAIYFFTLPIVCYDPGNLFIKKIGAKEVAVPLTDIKSISRGFFSGYKGSTTYIIKYFINGELRSIRLRKKDRSDLMPAFISYVKEINPYLET